uniref:Uncharacterized protein n=1 Tax=viral metagenome TaxID=1070528 RepID=A0A6M3J9X8_9ZZZZ
MAKKSMTIDEVKKRKIQLEKDVLKLLQEFETETGVRTGYINFDRGETDDVPVPTRGNTGKLRNVDINMELDLIY